MRLGSHEIHEIHRITRAIACVCHPEEYKRSAYKVNEIAQNLDVFLQVAPPLLAKSDDEFSPTNL